MLFWELLQISESDLESPPTQRSKNASAELHLWLSSLTAEFFKYPQAMSVSFVLSFDADWAHLKDVIYKQCMRRINYK